MGQSKRRCRLTHYLIYAFGVNEFIKFGWPQNNKRLLWVILDSENSWPQTLICGFVVNFSSEFGWLGFIKSILRSNLYIGFQRNRGRSPILYLLDRSALAPAIAPLFFAFTRNLFSLFLSDFPTLPPLPPDLCGAGADFLQISLRENHIRSEASVVIFPQIWDDAKNQACSRSGAEAGRGWVIPNNGKERPCIKMEKEGKQSPEGKVESPHPVCAWPPFMLYCKIRKKALRECASYMQGDCVWREKFFSKESWNVPYRCRCIWVLYCWRWRWESHLPTRQRRSW